MTVAKNLNDHYPRWLGSKMTNNSSPKWPLTHSDRYLSTKMTNSSGPTWPFSDWYFIMVILVQTIIIIPWNKLLKSFLWHSKIELLFVDFCMELVIYEIEIFPGVQTLLFPYFLRYWGSPIWLFEVQGYKYEF